ncbi:MAG TPA: endonuclease/exonuclease/phosphatase family protein [Desulfomonilia bacterium]|nr:endonuclease/exonuclease/phosphatase family protein [Desulfomonilia bacterium]
MAKHRPIRILSYNTHVCIKASKSSERLKNIWKHVLPSRCKLVNLKKISDLARSFDMVGIQESDAGSIRSGFRNQTKFMAQLGGFDYWAEQVNRDLVFARHSIGFLSRHPILSISRHQLPGKIPGRGLMVMHIDLMGEPVAFAVSHLSLGPRDRIKQAMYIGDIIHELDCKTILMGDFNCGSDSDELWVISQKTGLRPAIRNMPTYPSWRPMRDLDHFMVSEGIIITKAQVIDFPMSDHLPLAIEALIEGSGRQHNSSWPAAA